MLKVISLFLVVWSATSCSFWPDPRPDRQITLASWNVQNLFDEVANGDEYPEFDPAKGWTRERFWARCQSLSQGIRSLAPNGPDVLALEEVEGEHALSTLNQRFLSDLGYHHTLVAPASVPGIKTALLSRFPFVRTGYLFPSACEAEEPLRPLLEAEIDLGGRSLVVFACHWKSRLPTPKGTESLRRRSATVLSNRIKELEVRGDHPTVVALGDFNTSIELSRVWDDASLVSGASLEPGGGGPAEGLVVFSGRSAARESPVAGAVWDPWEVVTNPKGTYLYQGQWSKLDHAFLAASSLQQTDWVFDEFRVVDFAPAPRPWSPRTPDGVSDHFPVVLRLVRR